MIDQQQKVILAGDLGGTNCRLAIFDTNFSLIEQESYKCKDYENLEEIISDFINRYNYPIDNACIDLPAPVFKGYSQLIDLPWEVSAKSLEKIINSPVTLLNDIEATAYGLRTLKKQELIMIKKGNPIIGENRGVMAVGTGLGEALLIDIKGNTQVIASEGGHSDFGPLDDLQAGLLNFIQQEYERVSYDMILGGIGLVKIYNYLIASGKGTIKPWLSQKFKEKEAAAVIGEAGMTGECEVCAKAIDIFVSILAAEAGNIALRFLARGGVYLGGGIPPRILNKLTEKLFVKNFVNKDKISHLLQDIPVYVILNDKTALQGSAWYALQKFC